MDKIFWCCVIFLLTVVGFPYSEAESPRYRRERLRSSFFARQEFAGSEPNGNNGADQGPYPGPPQQAPYPAAGYRPAVSFNLPTEERRQVEQDVAAVAAFIPPTSPPTIAPIPNSAFPPIQTPAPTPSIALLPAQSYGAPSNEYGPPRQVPPFPSAGQPLPEFDESSGEEPAIDENEFEAFDIQGNQIQRLQNEQQEQQQQQQQQEEEEDDEEDQDDVENYEANDQGLYYVRLPSGVSQQVSYVSTPTTPPQVLAKIQLPPVVQTHQPLVLSNLVAPASFAYSQQYQSW